MSGQIVPLNNEKHRDLKVTAAVNIARIKNEYLLPLIIQEFIVVATEYPIVFVKHEHTGAFQAVAMLGIESKENLFCKGDRWDGLYIPRLIRNHPFSLVFKDEKKEEFMLCIDEAYQPYKLQDAHALFDIKGEQTEYLKKLVANMVSDAENIQLTASFVSYLAEKELLIANRLSIEIENEKRNIDGLYIIDETKLNALSMEVFEQLRQRGVLPAIYAHMSSLHQIPRLINRKQMRHR